MNRPAPDALLIAQHLSEWPVEDKHKEEKIYLYRMATRGEYRGTMTHNRYESPGGIALTDFRTNVLVVFDTTNMVKLHLVFVPDDEVSDEAQPHLGRDVDHEEWVEAREWLAQQETIHGD